MASLVILMLANLSSTTLQVPNSFDFYQNVSDLKAYLQITGALHAPLACSHLLQTIINSSWHLWTPWAS